MTASCRWTWGVWVMAVVLAGLASGGPTGRAYGDGFIVIDRPPQPPVRPGPVRPGPGWAAYMPLRVKHHHVDVELTDSAGVTKIDQVFANPNPQQMEGTYIFPLPEDVAVQRFSMYMNGQEVQGEVLDKDKARGIYEDIVRRMKDPALLEYVGTRMYKARVFPIPANGDVRIKLEYAQVVPVSAGLATYTYPLNTEKFSSAPLEEVAVRVRIKSQSPLTSVFCPSHAASIDRKGDSEAVVGYEGKNVLPDKDFIVGYQMSDKALGFVLLTHREAGEKGYFMARLAPSSKTDDNEVMPKDICFVIDTSGSMSGKKIEQARDALRFCLANLNRQDRFNIVPFSTEVRPYRDKLIAADEANVKDARQFVADLKAIGGTAINDALLAALESGKKTEREAHRPYMIVFLTDGLPTVGEREVPRILTNVKKQDPGNVRLFVFGVGQDVNTNLLDKLAEENHGARQYVAENEDLELKLSGFYTMVASPVLSDIRIGFGDTEATDVYPKVLPDLFRGAELVLFGRYAGGGKQTVTLDGQRGDKKLRFTWDHEFPKGESGNDYLPRLWASRKIGFLLDEIRLHGEDKELKEEVVRLAKEFGILTPYTSFLVVEEDRQRLARGLRPQVPAAPTELMDALGDSSTVRGAQHGFSYSAGRDAVAASKALEGMQAGAADADGEVRLFLDHADFGGSGGMGGYGSGYATGAPGAAGETGGKGPGIVQFVGSRTFYRNGTKWVDSRYDGQSETIKLRLFSDEYFDLLKRHPEAGKFFALGKQIVVVLDGKTYETLESNE